MTSKPASNTTLGTAALARLLDLSPQRVGQLVAAGVIAKQGRGQYLLESSVRAYVKFLRDQPAGGGGPIDYREMRSRLAKLQGDVIEVELARIRGSTVSIADAVGPLGEQCQTIRAKFLALASRIAPRVAGQDTKGAHATIHREVCEILRELTCDADAALQAEALAAGTAGGKVEDR